MQEKKTYTFEEAYEATLNYFDGDALAARVWVSKYAMKDGMGHIYEQTPTDMHWRIAHEIARIETNYPHPLTAEEVFALLDHFRYIIPAGSPMTGIGNDHQIASLSNCFVIGIDGDADSYGAIMRLDEEQVQLMKRRGGVGHDLSQIRPKGTPVNNSALTSTGLVPFMERFSNSTREVAQDGRRGALMLSVSIKHPDAGAFIDAKMEEGKVTGANVSVSLCGQPQRMVTSHSSFLSTATTHGSARKYRHANYGRKSSTTPGRARSPVYCFGTRSSGRASPTAMRTWDSGRPAPTPAARYHSVPTTVAVCSHSTSTPTSSTPSLPRRISTSTPSADMLKWPSASWTTS